MGKLRHGRPQVTHIKTIKREDELIEIQADTGAWHRRWLVRCLSLSQQVWGQVLPHSRGSLPHSRGSLPCPVVPPLILPAGL